MADSPAVRQRRRRAHQAGNHAMCGSDCMADRVSAAVDRAAIPGSVSEAVDRLADTLHFDDSDPRAVSLACARSLAAMVDAGTAGTMGAGQVSSIVRSLGVSPNAEPTEIDEIKAKANARMVEVAVHAAAQRNGGASGRGA